MTGATAPITGNGTLVEAMIDAVCTRGGLPDIRSFERRVVAAVVPICPDRQAVSELKLYTPRLLGFRIAEKITNAIATKFIARA